MGSYSISLQLLVQDIDWFINNWQFVKASVLHAQKVSKKNKYDTHLLWKICFHKYVNLGIQRATHF